MPDFDSMTEAELKAFRLSGNAQIRELRDELRMAGAALERLRAAADRAEYEAALERYGAEAVAAASRLIVAPPASAASRAPLGEDGVSSL